MSGQEIFSEETADRDPFEQFRIWFGEHLANHDAIPDQVFLGTATPAGKVSLRTVLLKDYNEEGFTFYTNYNSRKSRDLSMNNNAALLFYWPEKGRQVRIEGTAEKVSPEMSDNYFNSRPRESRISAWASRQSSEIPGRDHLEEKFRYYSETFKATSVPRPEHWGGFRIIPEYFEFWQDGKHRLHDRIVYTKNDNSWIIKRLAP